MTDICRKLFFQWVKSISISSDSYYKFNYTGKIFQTGKHKKKNLLLYFFFCLTSRKEKKKEKKTKKKRKSNNIIQIKKKDTRSINKLICNKGEG